MAIRHSFARYTLYFMKCPTNYNPTYIPGRCYLVPCLFMETVKKSISAWHGWPFLKIKVLVI